MNTDPGAMAGARIRELRTARGLSLSALAAASGIGKGSLSEIENGTRNPTLNTLYALAGELGVPLSTVVAAGPGAEISSPGITARLLDSTPGPDGTVEVFVLHLDAGATRTSPSHGTGVVEHLLVTGGWLRAGPRGHETEARSGETVEFVADGPHTYAALGDDPVDAVLVIRSPR